MRERNLFFAGDNIKGLQYLHDAGISVDLVCIDPPYATGQEFRMNGNRANTISAAGSVAYCDKTTGAAYLKTLENQLVAIRQVMGPAASIYVHIGINVEHKVRIIMDRVFGERNFRNSIARIKCNPKNFHRLSFGNVRDAILFYTLSQKEMTWNPQRVPYTESELERLYSRVDGAGRRYTTTPLHAPGETKDGATGEAWRGVLPPEGRHWRIPPEDLEALDDSGRIAWSSTGNPRKIKYADESEGKLPQDVWEYKDPQKPDYPTQKNAEMLRHIILTSSNEDDIVLDCFAGSGETLMQAYNLKRRFVGMDSGEWSQQVISDRLNSHSMDWMSENGIFRLRGQRARCESAELARYAV